MAFGGWIIFAVVSLYTQPPEDPGTPVAALLGIGPAIVFVMGVCFLPLGFLGLLAGLGVLLRKQWGRILTFILAALAILLGLTWVGDRDATHIAIGVAQVLYGIFAFVILIRNRTEFSRPRV